MTMYRIKSLVHTLNSDMGTLSFAVRNLSKEISGSLPRNHAANRLAERISRAIVLAEEVASDLKGLAEMVEGGNCR